MFILLLLIFLGSIAPYTLEIIGQATFKQGKLFFNLLALRASNFSMWVSNTSKCILLNMLFQKLKAYIVVICVL